MLAQPSLTSRTIGAIPDLFPLVISAAFTGALFAHLHAAGFWWLPALSVMLGVICLAISQANALHTAPARAAAAKWPIIDAPWIQELGAAHGVAIAHVVEVPATGAFWIHAGRSSTGTPRGIIALGQHLDPDHLHTTLSHEFAHGALEHLPARARATSIALVPMMLPATAAFSGPAITACIAVLAGVGSVLWFCSFCRRQEIEADIGAAMYAGQDNALGMLDSLAPFATSPHLCALHPPVAARKAAVSALS